MDIDLAGVVVLAGGNSSRMGSPKALLTLPSRQTLLDFHIENANLLNVPILVADNGKNFTNSNQSGLCITDFVPENDLGNAKTGNGALTAIVGAMQYLQEQNLANNGYLLVISCDSLIRADKLLDGLKNGKNADIRYFKGEKDYPLLGLYRLTLLPSLIEYLDTGNRAVMKLLAGIKCEMVDLPSNWEILANFNTMAEFELALTQLLLER